jgi:hypothetical protein
LAASPEERSMSLKSDFKSTDSFLLMSRKEILEADVSLFILHRPPIRVLVM